MKKKIKLFKTIYYIVVAFISIITLLLIVSVFPIANFRIKNVLSGSMEPIINKGDIVVIRSVYEYKVDDIITFQFPRELPVTHRIYNIELDNKGNSLFFTKGDVNEESDPSPVREEKIIGKVLFSIPFVGYLINSIQHPLGFILIIIIPATIILYEEFRKIRKEILNFKLKHKKDKKQDKKIEENEEKDLKQDEEIQKLKQEIEKFKNK